MAYNGGVFYELPIQLGYVNYNTVGSRPESNRRIDPVTTGFDSH